MKKYLIELLSDERGRISSKRISGLICVMALVVALVANAFCSKGIAPSDNLVNAITILAIGCLGLTSVDKIWGKKQGEKKPRKE